MGELAVVSSLCLVALHSLSLLLSGALYRIYGGFTSIKEPALKGEDRSTSASCFPRQVLCVEYSHSVPFVFDALAKLLVKMRKRGSQLSASRSYRHHGLHRGTTAYG